MIIDLSIDNHQLWDLIAAYLYHLNLALVDEDGNLYDRQTHDLRFRRVILWDLVGLGGRR